MERGQAAYGNYGYAKPGGGFGPMPTGSLRTTRSANAYHHPRGELAGSLRTHGQPPARPGPTAYDGDRPAAYGGDRAAPYGGNGHAAYGAVAAAAAHLQPYVADSSERRAAGYHLGVQAAGEYGYHRAGGGGDAIPSGPAPYRRGSIASSRSGGHDAASGRGTPADRHHRAGARLAGGGAASQRVEFGYASPVMATLDHSPEDDEIADIMADMTKARITTDGSPIRVFLQLGADTKRADLADEPTHTALVNLFIDKYRGRLADDPDALPAVYIRDPKTSVPYELEDMADVVDGCVLCWHTRPLAPPREAEPAAEDAPASTAVAEGLAALTDSVAQLRAQLAAAVDGMREEARTAAAAAAAAVAPTIAAEKPAATIARSLSMPAAGDDADDAAPLAARLQRAELALAVARQERREADERAAADRAALAAELERLRADVGRHPNVLRARIEEGKDALKTRYRAYNAGFEDVHALVQAMRKDVARRGSIPSEQMMRSAAARLRDIADGARSLTAFIADSRADWKRAWEEELQNILKEQEFVKDVEQMLAELLDDTRHLDDVLAKLDKIIALKLRERAQDDYVPPAATRFIDVVAPDDVRDAKKDFLKQIACVDVDHARRLDALHAAERLRRQELAAKVNEFDEELADFVSSRRLRKTGGTEELERRRAEKDIEVMRDMLKSVEEAELARRAKLAERRAAAKKPASKKRTPLPESITTTTTTTSGNDSAAAAAAAADLTTDTENHHHPPAADPAEPMAVDPVPSPEPEAPQAAPAPAPASEPAPVPAPEAPPEEARSTSP
ncbi:Bud site selection protein 6 [Coemansia javaensis]|uniref:Bud site selection protein 6 n=1 Tax=Coemansia javaensis TaxID=2761396 RepID=A0A9W8HJN8_9FUNG|nr:Bud site selection protein 6 [Coemansia javaensis]